MDLKTRIKLFKLTKSNDKDVYQCKECGVIDEPLIKLGGLICPNCRLLLVLPETKEYSRLLNRKRKTLNEQSE